MSCLYTRAEIEAKISKFQTQLDNLNDILDAESAKPIKGYRLDTTQGSERVTLRDLKELTEQIDILERRIDYWKRRLCGKLVTNQRVMRKC